MTSVRIDDISVAMTLFLMMCLGFWQATNRREGYLKTIGITYTTLSFIFFLSVQIMNIYKNCIDLTTCIYPINSLLTTLIPSIKVFILLPRQQKLFFLIEYLKRKLMYANDNNHETSVLADCKRKCTLLVCFFLFLLIMIAVSLVAAPLIGNIGRNESDRKLMLDPEIDFPVSMTPYFEIIFSIETVLMWPIVIGYTCFDSILCILNIYTAGQFRILQYRMSNMSVIKDMDKLKDTSNESVSKFTEEYRAIFINYIQQHQALITYCDLLEDVFSLLALIQIFLFSISICLSGYQILLLNEFAERIPFYLHLTSTICQLLMFTYSSDSLIRESRKLAHAVYSGPWVLLPTNRTVQKLRKDLILVIMRSDVPCCLTAYGFFVVSLETCCRVLSTAASYFTLLTETQDVDS